MAKATSTAKPMPVHSGSTARRKPRATPPNAEWEMPTPMKAMRRSTTKTDRTPHSRLTMLPASKARCRKPISRNSVIVRLHPPVGNLPVEEVLHAAAERALKPQAAAGGRLMHMDSAVDADDVVHVAGHAANRGGDHVHRESWRLLK